MNVQLNKEEASFLTQVLDRMPFQSLVTLRMVLGIVEKLNDGLGKGAEPAPPKPNPSTGATAEATNGNGVVG